jgi:hypothetical protein
MIRNITTLPKLYDLPLALLLPHNRKRRVRIPHLALRVRIVPARPANHVHKAAAVAVGAGHAERAEEPVFERCERDAESRVEDLVEAQRAVEIVVRVVEGEADVFGEGGGVTVHPVGVRGEGVEAWVKTSKRSFRVEEDGGVVPLIWHCTQLLSWMLAFALGESASVQGSIMVSVGM